MLKTSLFTSLILSTLLIAHAHPPSPEKARAFSPGDSRSSNFLNESYPFPSTTGGYGYLCLEDECSESYAVSQFDFECPPSPKQVACPGNPKTINETPMEALSRKVFTDKLREKLFEYLKLSTAANPVSYNNAFKTNTNDTEDLEVIDTFDLGIPAFDGENAELSSNWPSPVPNCLKNSKLFSDFSSSSFNLYRPKIRKVFDQSVEININESNEMSDTLSDKADILGNRHNPKNIIRTLMYDKFLDFWEQQNKGKIETLDSIKFQRQKMRGSYPNLFNPSGKRHPESESIIKKMFSALGVSAQKISKEKIDFKDTEKLGEETFNKKIKKSQTSYPSVLKELFENINYIEEEHNKKSGTSTPEASFFKDIESDIFALAKRQLELEESKKKSICNMGVKEIAQGFPNVFRQTMVELNKKNLPLARSLICKDKVKDIFSKPIRCGKKNGDMNSEKGLDVKIKDASFPYGGSGNYFNVRKNKTGDTILKKKILMSDEVGLSGDMKDCLKRRVANAMTKDLNCQVGDPRSPSVLKLSPLDTPLCGERKVFNNDKSAITRRCPAEPNKKRKPTVRFEIEVEFVSPADSNKTISLHKCYRAEIEDKSLRGNCLEVGKYNTKECINSAGRGTACFQKTSDQINKCCQDYVKTEMEKGNMFRQNAANMTPGADRGVWYHEILHGFGLDDEYSDGTYPMANMGEHNSVMKNAGSRESMIYPRHVDEILRRVDSCK